MRAMEKKWGNSAALRLPASIIRAARLDLDAPVDIREEDGRVIIAPMREVELSLAELVAGTTDGLCCANRVRDSCRESSVVVGRHEQSVIHHLQDQELAGLQ